MTWHLLTASGQRYPIGPSGLRLGRAADNDIVLPDAEASRHHAVLQVQGDDVWITDLGSFNGVFVNDARIAAPQRLQAGDVIRLGQTSLTLDRVQPAPAGAPPAARAAPTSPSYWPAVLAGVGMGLIGLLLVVVFFVRPLLRQVGGAVPSTGGEGAGVYANALSSVVFLLTPIEGTPNANAATAAVVSENGRLLTAYRRGL